MQTVQQECPLGPDGAPELHARLLWGPSAFMSVAIAATGDKVAPGVGSPLTAGDDMVHGGGPAGAAQVLATVTISSQDASGPPSKAELGFRHSLGLGEDHSMEGLGDHLFKAEFRPGPQIQGVGPTRGEGL